MLSVIMKSRYENDLLNHKKNYPTHDLEMVAMVFTLEIWMHYLYRKKV